MVSREVWSACMESRLETTGLYPTSERPRDRDRAMRRPLGIAARAGSARPRSASAVLGSDHPLARATEALDSAVRQWLAVAAVLVGSTIDLLGGPGVGRHPGRQRHDRPVGTHRDRRGLQTEPTRPRARSDSRGPRQRPSRRRATSAPTPPGPADANDAGAKPRGHDRSSVNSPRTASLQDRSAVRACRHQGGRGRSPRRHSTARLRPRAGAWRRARRAPPHRRLLAAVRKRSRACCGKSFIASPTSSPDELRSAGPVVRTPPRPLLRAQTIQPSVRGRRRTRASRPCIPAGHKSIRRTAGGSGWSGGRSWAQLGRVEVALAHERAVQTSCRFKLFLGLARLAARVDLVGE